MVFSQILNRNIDKDFAGELDFKNIKFAIKIRYTHKIKKNSFIGISVFDYENKGKYLISCVKKFFQKTC